MTINEFVKYITEKLVSYLEMTKQEKIETKKNRIKKKHSDESFFSLWFGILPISVKLFMKKD